MECRTPLLILAVFGLVLLSGCADKAKAQDYCTAPTGERMSLSEAIKIAGEGECAQGQLKQTSFCNDNSGTWWIELDIIKEGCNPACVISAASKTSEINWRCTGLKQ